MSFEDRWVTINQVPTRVLSWGKHMDEDLTDVKDMFLCISGNPGISRYYKIFLNSLHKKTGKPCWIVCHAGHEIPPQESQEYLKLPKIKQKENECYFNLQGQIEHKIKFIESHVPNHVNLYLIGHSVGARMIIDLLKQNKQLSSRITRCYLLFPTLEHFRNTPNANFLAPLLKYFMSVILFLSGIFSLFPRKLRAMLIYYTFRLSRGENSDSESLEATVDLVQPDVLRHVFFLVQDEMEKIKELNVETLEENSNKLRIYFGLNDGWCPVWFYENLKEKCPSVNATLCNENIQHAFVVSSSEVMADKVALWYAEDHLSVSGNVKT